VKNHIVFKFLALLLCAAMLLVCAASGLGIFAMNEAGLYQQSYEKVYGDYRRDILQHTANAIAARYAAMELGGLDDRMADAYYGGEWYLNQFHFGTMGYTLYDSEKNPLKTYDMIGHDLAERHFLNTTQQEYPKLEAVLEQQAYREIHGIPEPEPSVYYDSGEGRLVYDAVPYEGAVVTMMNVSYGDSSEGVGSPEGLGTIFHDAEGFVVFQSYERHLLDMSRRSELKSITFENDDLGVLYELSDPQGIGLLYTDPEGYVNFISDTVSPAYVPPTTEAQEAEESSAPTEEPAMEWGGFSAGANIYAAPHGNAEILGTLTEEDTTLSYQEYQVDGGVWYLCEKGWVMGEPVSDAEMTHTPEPAENAVALYSTPNRDSTPVGTLEAGAKIEIIREVDVMGESWVLIPEGWLLKSALDTGAEKTAVEETIVPTEETVPETTVETVPETTIETIPEATEETIPTVQPEAVDYQYMEYRDWEQDQNLVMQYTLEEAPEYTVEFHLAENALRGSYAWVLLGLVWNFQQYLFPALFGSALLFAILLVYLCCAAGRKPGTQEIRAGGLNRFPLDGWMLVLFAGITGAVLLGVEGTEYLMQGSINVGLAFAAAMAYGAALLIVSFCFAFAAQVKTPGGFWWRGSLVGWCWKLCVICLAWCIKAARVFWDWFCRFCKWLARVCDEKLGPWMTRFCLGVWKVVCVIAGVFWKWFVAALRLFMRGCDWLGAKLVRFVALLPMTWQWLLSGFAIIIVLALTVNTSIGFWGICLCIALVLYGTHAFGTLLEAVKHMRKGDLDNKVDDKLLIGSFREFAGELNGLADVAVVAAQKQLKSERMKTELITNVSHDIKTPLTSIINYVDLLEKPHTPEEQEVYLEVLSRQSQRLKKLIEDLMEMSKASTGNMSVEIVSVDAVEAVNQALGEFADKLDRAELIPVFRHPEEPITMLADGRLAWRVLSNLLSNAAKYALPGTRLYLDVAAVEDKVIISIKNISREELNVNADELMERFVRGDASRNTEGSGLGLNIAKSLMELQKGQLQILVDGDLFKVTLIFPSAA